MMPSGLRAFCGRRAILASLALSSAAGSALGANVGCSNLQGSAPPDTRITSASLQPAGSFVIPADLGPARTVQLPALCRIQGVIAPTADSNISFEVWLPAEGWNGRFLGVGNGGFAGSIGYATLSAAVQGGYAAASTDTGHGPGTTDASWAIGHPEKVTDFGWRAVHLTTLAGKAFTAAFYGKSADWSYFNSCSNGGRQGLMEAQRFPEDYDGIIAGAPAYRWTGLFTGFVWNAQALSKPGAAIPAAKAATIAGEVLKQCDARDGVVDGIISDPRKCNVDVRKLQCAANGTESTACLTPLQIKALQAIYQGPQTSSGKRIYFGFPPGGETAPGSAGWDAWIFGAAPGASIQNAFGSSFVRQIVGAPANWSPADFDFDRDYAPLEAKTAATFNATNPDLSRFAARGGKLILYHGWSDAAIPATGTIDYHDNVMRRMGAKRAEQFVRLFVVPGMHHCAGGAGPSDFGQEGAPSPADTAASNVIVALQEWVERGQAPHQLVARQQSQPGSAGNPPPRTGLICAYPKRAELRKGADLLRAESYSCRAP
jgi:hypothetical protein